MSDVKSQFEDASRRVRKLSNLSNESLLDLYALFKQASVGDVTGKRPGMLDVKGRAKFDAWKKISGMAPEAAMTDYCSLVTRLEDAQ